LIKSAIGFKHGGMSESKVVGNVRADRIILEDEHFAFFDQLPKPVREELANAPYPMAAQAIVRWMEECRQGGMEDLQIAELILYRFRQYLKDKVKQEVTKLYGPDHPQSGPH
jgi:hypothetical protein